MKQEMEKTNRSSAAGHRQRLEELERMAEADESYHVDRLPNCQSSLGVAESESGVRPSSAVLVVSPIQQDREVVCRTLRRTHRAYTASSYREAVERLSRGGIAVVLWDCDLPDATWVDLLTLVAESADAPLLIVASRLADERLWATVINLGGFDVIAKPFEPREVEHVVKTAWVCRRDPALTRHFAGA